MCSCLHADETLRYFSKRLLHRFRCRRYFLLQKDFACFVQNTVERPTISQIHTDAQLLLFENFATKCLHSANLLHRRSPFLCFEHVFHWQRIASRQETGLLIPSDKRSRNRRSGYWNEPSPKNGPFPFGIGGKIQI